MELPKTYSPSDTETKWYDLWMKYRCFESQPDERPSYSIVIPPPNITGVLHMGHMLNNTIQDVLIRKARMSGFNACWVPGTDHASIATEAKVLQYLKEKGVEKSAISRDEFLQHAMDWKEKYGGIILQQLKKLGASCDWNRTKFTMDQDMNESVLRVFIDLYKKGFIYRGVRMINWDPKAKTALSDEEVIYKEVKSNLYSIRYVISGLKDEYITIATTRPETMLGDTAIAVHPKDERYKHLHGKKALVPLINREIPIILDEYVDREFGTGALKVTPAHDINDYNLGIKHNLPTIDILNDDGTLNAKATMFIGEDRFIVRKKIVKQLTENKQLTDSKEIQNNVGYSERTDVVIEPKLSMQWFCKMTDLAKPALDHVLNDDVKFYPSKFKNTYQHWMENIKDWCISRQLWWGQRIPAYYYGQGANDFVLAFNQEEALQLIKDKTGKTYTTEQIRQDEDVLDTWFSSWLWPISVFDGINNPKSKDLAYYYPTQDLVTGPDIIFFWVARMIMAGYAFTNQKPFKNVYFTGIIRDKQGRKMSKSLGNSPDALELIEKYGADGVRAGMLFSSPAGNDLLFDEALCEQGRNFCNKLWNSFRLLHAFEVKDLPQPNTNEIAYHWMNQKISDTLETLNDHFSKFRLSDALMSIYKLIWDDYCAWYLEMIKPAFGSPIDRKTYDNTQILFKKLLQILHPFMPFITEELWHAMGTKEDDFITLSTWPKASSIDVSLLEHMTLAQNIISEIRNFRNSKGISPKEILPLQGKQESPKFAQIIEKLGFVQPYQKTQQPEGTSYQFLLNNQEFFIPLNAGMIDLKKEREKLMQELQYTQGFLNSILKKLENERFVSGAPKHVLDMELKKKSDSEEKIKILEQKLAVL